jgi:hypothetical protein
MNGAKIETMIYRWLFRTFDRKGRTCGGRPKIAKSFKLLYTILMDIPEVRLILNKECPYCRRKFKRRAPLSAHLIPYGLKLDKASDCKIQFALLMNQITDIYIKMRYMIRYKSGKYYVKGCLGYFKTLREAYIKAKELISNSKYSFS